MFGDIFDSIRLKQIVRFSLLILLLRMMRHKFNFEFFFYFGIITDVDDVGGVMLVLQLLILLQTSNESFDGGVVGSTNVDTHDGLSASGSGFIAGNMVEVERLIGIT